MEKIVWGQCCFQLFFSLCIYNNFVPCLWRVFIKRLFFSANILISSPVSTKNRRAYILFIMKKKGFGRCSRHCYWPTLLFSCSEVEKSHMPMCILLSFIQSAGGANNSCSFDCCCGNYWTTFGLSSHFRLYAGWGCVFPELVGLLLWLPYLRLSA